MDIRKSFARIGTAIPFPDFLEEQRRSFERLIQAGVAPSEREDVGLQAAFQRAFPVRTPDGRFESLALSCAGGLATRLSNCNMD